MFIKTATAAAFTALALSACGTASTTQHTAESKPPQMIHHTQNNHSYMWNYSDRFGAIPASESERAAHECNKYKAGSTPVGYLAHALDINGNPIPGGAFSCRG